VRPTVVLFDIDGTLVTCGGAGKRAMRAAFRYVSERDDVWDFPFGGGTDRGLARQAFRNAGIDASEEQIDVFLSRYLDELPATLASSPGYAIYPGVLDLLDHLEKQANYAIGLGTGNVERGARTKLVKGDLGSRFAFGGFGDDHEQRPLLIEAGARRGAARLGRPLDQCRVVVIGDTHRDVEAALAIGAECIAVATGGTDLQELLRCGATYAVADLTAPQVTELLRS
jgi:phosphoglycolate phosphatase